MIPKQLFIVDIETTGLNPLLDMICEIGVVRLDTDLGTIESVYGNVFTHGVKINYVKKDAWIFRNTDLSLDVVVSASDIRDYKDFFNKIFRDRWVASYNHAFDIKFLSYNGIRCPNVWDYDIMKVLTNYLKIPHIYYGYKYPSVAEAYEYLFDVKYVSKHRALDDAKDEAKIIMECIKRGIVV